MKGYHMKKIIFLTFVLSSSLCLPAATGRPVYSDDETKSVELTQVGLRHIKEIIGKLTTSAHTTYNEFRTAFNASDKNAMYAYQKLASTIDEYNEFISIYKKHNNSTELPTELAAAQEKINAISDVIRQRNIQKAFFERHICQIIVDKHVFGSETSCRAFVEKIIAAYKNPSITHIFFYMGQVAYGIADCMTYKGQHIMTFLQNHPLKKPWITIFDQGVKSGGYLVFSASEWLLSTSGESVIGSIGVAGQIAWNTNKWIIRGKHKLEGIQYKFGRHNTLHKKTPEDINKFKKHYNQTTDAAYLPTIHGLEDDITKEYNFFVDQVKEGRQGRINKLTQDQYLEAQVMTTKDALPHGLLDGYAITPVEEMPSYEQQAIFMQDAVMHGITKSTTLLPKKSVYEAKVSPESIMHFKKKAYDAMIAEEKRD